MESEDRNASDARTIQMSQMVLIQLPYIQQYDEIERLLGRRDHTSLNGNGRGLPAPSSSSSRPRQSSKVMPKDLKHQMGVKPKTQSCVAAHSWFVFLAVPWKEKGEDEGFVVARNGQRNDRAVMGSRNDCEIIPDMNLLPYS